MTGNAIAQGWPVAGLTVAGPDEPMQLPSTLAQTMKCRAGSIGLPGPTIRVPPAGLAGDRMVARDMLVAGQRVADQDRGLGAGSP